MYAGSRWNTHLHANRAVRIDELDMGEFCLDFLNLRVVDCATDETLEGADGVAEVGDL